MCPPETIKLVCSLLSDLYASLEFLLVQGKEFLFFDRPPNMTKKCPEAPHFTKIPVDANASEDSNVWSKGA